jgi:(2Fe-2S) ferredoxin
MSDHPIAHLFICHHEKDSEKPSCGKNLNLNASQFKKELKEVCRERWGKRVRINSSGCLGKCSRGVAAVLYPSGKWYLKLDKNDFETILKDLENHLTSK